MITERDLEQAIAECQGERNPNASTCIKLAAFYTIRNEMFGTKPDEPSYSYAPPPQPADTRTIDYDSGSEFAQVIHGRDAAEIWPIMDELMDTIHALIPKLYDGVLRKLQE